MVRFGTAALTGLLALATVTTAFPGVSLLNRGALQERNPAPLEERNAAAQPLEERAPVVTTVTKTKTKVTTKTKTKKVKKPKKTKTKKTKTTVTTTMTTPTTTTTTTPTITTTTTPAITTTTTPANPPASPTSPTANPPAASPSASCSALPSSYTDSQGVAYTIECATDRDGGNLAASSSDSFAGCFAMCDALAGCVGFAYVGGSGPGTCYFKSSLVGPTSNSNVDTAYNSQPGSSDPAPAPAPAPAPTSATPAPAPTSGPAAGSCAAIDGTAYNSDDGNSYTVACNADLNGSDLQAVASDTFQGCFSLCDAYTECQGFSYLPGTCYLKNNVDGTTSPNGSVNSAFMA
ncbi:uncharacterized protein LTR77_008515 [Saxophila tyrrhenica]|uniref:Apple domain-containing protein n=1 Tax=Saxophila tyrrhenica TaxID=1690608 RepID=A0AAV9P144_9PEZI|nr:hypothetical protein LTR77_008515 [Saxophila tyrrhenica]